MITSLLSIPIAILCVEIAPRIYAGLDIRNKLKEINAQLYEFYKEKTDDERQRLILLSGFKTLRLSLIIFLWMFFFIALVFSEPWLLNFDQTQYTHYLLLLSINGVLWSILRYFRFKRSFHLAKKKALAPLSNPYNQLERWLHWFALEKTWIRQLSFDLEKVFALRPQRNIATRDSTNGPVYICGLARSGTTIVLHILDQAAIFCSLSYRDMPFVLAPNLWKQLTKFSSKQTILAERAHKDGILVGYNSPEAFEEVFWRTFSAAASCSTDVGYSTATPTPETLAAFKDYRNLVVHSKTNSSSANTQLRRYLSKNNNNLIRLEHLSADCTATIFIVYRNPVDTARSLHRLHQQFCATYQHDRFSQAYMRWLGHHEFGPGHRPFHFALVGMNPSLSPDDPNYWLDYWNAVHRHLLQSYDIRCYYIEHEALRAKPQQMIEAIFQILGVEADHKTMAELIKSEKNSNTSPDEFDEKILQQANEIHRALQKSSKNILINH